MANRPNQKLRLLFLLKILMEKTDSTHGLTTQQIIEELAYHDLEAERKAIYRDLQTLRDFGLNVDQRGGKEWALASRPLDLQELIMLVDAVQSSPFLTDGLTDHLIGKLQSLASLGERELMHKRVDVPSRVKMQNSDALLNIDLIQQAMREKRKIRFRYFHYNAAKQKALNHDGKTYELTPVRLIYSDELYYMIGFRDKWANAGSGHQPFTPYRVDRMLDVAVSEESATKDPRIAGYVLEDHVSPSFGVYAADKTTVVLELDDRAMNPLIDKFGLDAVVFENQDGRLLATVKAPLSPQFYGWLLQLSTFIKIVQPQSAIDTYLDYLDSTRALYRKTGNTAMNMTPELIASLDRLNPEQREAVECLDGPLLVIAGPGTGKTQLLSLRAANILAKRDAAPRNILCLTYTEAGAEAMRKRLIELIGRDAYGIEVSTFHGFASSIRSRYPEYFMRPSTDTLVTSLHQQEIFDRLLKSLPFGSPLGGGSPDMPAPNIGKMIGFVSKVKRSGLDYDTLSAIAQQNIDAAAWLTEHSELLTLACERASAALAERFEEEVERACAMAPTSLTRPIGCPAGTYVPYILELRDTVRRTELIDEKGKSSGYTKVRDNFFGGSNSQGRTFKIAEQSERLKAACDVARRYQDELDQHHLYDYDDMIGDFVYAVEHNGALRQTLQDTYTYIQVDEFQDTNGAQMRIIELLCDGTDAPNIMAVGDDDQAIMRFQGATIECANQFAAEFSPRSIVLKTNYRSTPAIVELGQAVAQQIEYRLDASSNKSIEAFRPQGDQVSFSENVYTGKAEEYAAVAASIKQRINTGYLDDCEDSDEGIAVISAKHAALRSLIPFLVKDNVPFSYRERQNLFASERMQTTLALLRCVTALARGQKELASSYLPQIICATELGGDHPSSVAFALNAKREHHGDWMAAMCESVNTRVKELYESLMQWAAEADASPVRALIFKIVERSLGYYRYHKEQDPLGAAEFNAGIRALLAFAEGEMGDARRMERTLRLPDIVDKLDAAQKYGVSIDASIDLGTPGAVRLTSAHSSKGLEFDCVYLLDADDSTWHKGAGGMSLYPSNLLIRDEKDDDDARRLLFVAITRAKRHLELYRAGGSTLQELTGLIDSCEVAAETDQLGAAIETEWRDNYVFDTPELRALLEPHTDVKHLSATALNNFVTYEPGCANGQHFPEKQIVHLPTAPTIQTEFGTIVHAMFEEIVNRMAADGEAAIETIEAEYRQQISWLDFAPEDVHRYSERFERICRAFVPWLVEHVHGYRCVTEANMQCLTTEGTPLFGFLDLLLVDDAAKTVQIVDYKTGFGKEVPAGYHRQLKFYKLLVEASPEFYGYTVSSMGDYYVEPDKTTGELRPPFATTANADDIAELEQLIDAVWSRIEHGAWDTSAFEQSDAHELAIEEQKGCRKKADKAEIMQRAYERWLVENPGL